MIPLLLLYTASLFTLALWQWRRLKRQRDTWKRLAQKAMRQSIGWKYRYLACHARQQALDWRVPTLEQEKNTKND